MASSSPAMDLPATQAKARDIERMTDIKALHGQLEVYFNDKGTYPSLANLNDTTWRTANMRGLDLAALKDPAWTSTTAACNSVGKATLISTPINGCYGYKAIPVNCGPSSCTKYTLSVLLEEAYAGSKTYTKEALN